MKQIERIRHLLLELPDEQRRVLRDVRPLKDGRIEIDGKQAIDFASNDYLGLSQHPELVARAARWAEQFGVGSRASRLISGNLKCLGDLESKVAQLKGTETALIMGSGFQANSSVLAALVYRRPGQEDQRVHVFTDRLCHASFHFGFAAAGAKQRRYQHNDMQHLQYLLEEKTGESDAILIATESVFSMDGDRLDVAAIRQLAKKHDAMLYVDEAHATGVTGESGMGLLAGTDAGDAKRSEVIIGTFGKALGCYGSYVACSNVVREYLINRCAGLIYSTALPPMVLGAIDAALDLVPQLDSQRAHLDGLARRLRSQLQAAGFDTLNSDTHIVPILVGDDERVMEVAGQLLDAGFLVAAIRPPTVPVRAARLRISVSAIHSMEQIEWLVDAIKKFVPIGVSG